MQTKLEETNIQEKLEKQYALANVVALTGCFILSAGYLITLKYIGLEAAIFSGVYGLGLLMGSINWKRNLEFKKLRYLLEGKQKVLTPKEVVEHAGKPIQNT